MRSRKDILKDLLFLRGDIEMLKKELSKYPWDIQNPLVKIKIIDLSNILKSSIKDEIDFGTLTNWADAIECRDDFEFEIEAIQEIIFELANPEINGKITKERLSQFINLLER